MLVDITALAPLMDIVILRQEDLIYLNCHLFQPDMFKFTCSLLSWLIFMCQPDSQGSWYLCSLPASV